MRFSLIILFSVLPVSQAVADYHESYGDIFSKVIEPKVERQNTEVIMSATHLLKNVKPPKLRMQKGQFYKITYKDPSRKLFIRSNEDEVNAQALVEELELLGVVNVHYVPYQLEDYPEGYGKRYMVMAGPFNDHGELQRSEDELVMNGYFYITQTKPTDQ